MFTRENTIAAIATAPLASAIGIVRISGPASAQIISTIVPGTRAAAKPRRVFSGTAIDPLTGDAIDEVLCFHCKAPNTATGEDTAEIHGHGGPYVMKKLLDAVLCAGAVAAEPGEFTYRAYRNGRFDLTQAEAIMGLIGARSSRAAKVAMGQLDGTLGRTLAGKLDELVAVSAELEAGLDYPDEDLEPAESNRMASQLVAIAKSLAVVRDSYTLGSRLTDGARVAIVGPPNAGKSSLLNRLVGEDRALVDPDPGTTRDVVEARGEARGISLLFLDTAGLRKGADRIESRGIEKTLKSVETADLVITVVDGSIPADDYIQNLDIPNHPAILIAVNKVDLQNWNDPQELETKLPNRVHFPTSASSGAGIDKLIDAIADTLAGGVDEGTDVLTTARQHQSVATCVDHTEKAAQALEAGADPELAAVDLRTARDVLARLWGRNATDDMLGSIFERFCVGK